MDQTVSVSDLARRRGLSDLTLNMFHVRLNGTGWLYDTKLVGGGVGTRWKSFYSLKEEAPADERENWKKYKWYPGKPPAAKYFYPPSLSLIGAIQDASNHLWLVGGDIASMTMIEAGILHTISCFGDNDMPDSFEDDLKDWKVLFLHLVPDRDKSGLEWAIKIRNRLYDKNPDIQLKVYALPYDLEDKHGKDINDFWRDQNDTDEFEQMLMALPEWVLPEREIVAQLWQKVNDLESDNQDIPALLKAEIRSRLGVYEQFNNEGWSRKNVKCPFHDDKQPSATWNDEKSILHCHAGCHKDYLVRDLCEHFGIRMADYFDPIPMSPALHIAAKPSKVVQLKPTLPKEAPPLPPHVALDEDQLLIARQGRKWLDTYVKWAGEAANATPMIFHEAMGLWLLATAATRRVKLQIGGLDIYPNLYIMIVARTSVYCKSTGMSKAAAVLSKANLDVLKLPGETTPEALFDELAGVKPVNFDKLPTDMQRRWMLGRAFAGQRAIMKDEASSILANLKKEYMGGLSELLLQGYDSHEGTIDKRVQSRGYMSISNLSLCFLGATTPVMWGKYVTTEENENGLTPRFVIITPEGPPDEREAPDVIELPPEIVNSLRRMFLDTLPGEYKMISPMMDEVIAPPVATASISPMALAQLKAYHKTLRVGFDGKIEDSKAASYGRLGIVAYKVALLLATVDSPTPQIRVEDRHAYAAQLIVERWRESLHRLDKQVNHSRSGDLHDKLLRYIENFGETGVTLREIMRDFNLETRAKAMDKLQVIAEAGLIERFDRKPEGRGRPSICYRIAS